MTCSSAEYKKTEFTVEVSNAIAVLERDYQYLRRSYSIIKRDAPDTNEKDKLQMTVKSINDYIGPHDRVSRLRVHVNPPRLRLQFDQPHPSLNKRANADRKATEELVKIFATKQVKSALSSQHVPNVQSSNEACMVQFVLVYCTKLKAWKGPCRLLGKAR